MTSITGKTCEQLERDLRLRWLLGGIAFGLAFPLVGWLVAVD